MTTLLAITKYMSRSKRAAVKDIDIVSISAMAIFTIFTTVTVLSRFTSFYI